ncbi:hypothetical protein OH720_12420 [Pseudomonas sp. WJP1]|uniref:hypothetical protein n=1 Tax=Pseudomonas sp. WJP1 TaxID=2986947 RepID=UPI00234AA624|nr:hypothetical protein [Pseudomonas sp. WJP1]WCM53773.1 hypothetical protein OH720_12420 [Pseudomonas sp. WJP1]
MKCLLMGDLVGASGAAIRLAGEGVYEYAFAGKYGSYKRLPAARATGGGACQTATPRMIETVQ